MHDQQEAVAQGTGLRVIALLALLTLVEFAVFMVIDASAPLIMLLIPIALAKAYLIVIFFMHVSRVWRGEEEAR